MIKAKEIFKQLKLKVIDALFLVERLEDKKQSKKRLDVCLSNAGGCYDEQREQCRQCGCYPEVKTTMLKHFDIEGKEIRITHCPLSKWGGKDELEIVNHYRQIDGKELLTI